MPPPRRSGGDLCSAIECSYPSTTGGYSAAAAREQENANVCPVVDLIQCARVRIIKNKLVIKAIESYIARASNILGLTRPGHEIAVHDQLYGPHTTPKLHDGRIIIFYARSALDKFLGFAQSLAKMVNSRL